MYFVIEQNYTGPHRDHDKYIDARVVVISRCADMGIPTIGWDVIMHGQHDTVEAARAAIKEIFGAVRVAAFEDVTFGCDEDVLEVYKPGQYERLSWLATMDWCDEGIFEDINVDTTDAQIADLAKDYERVGKGEGVQLTGNVEGYLREQRDRLREEVAAGW